MTIRTLNQSERDAVIHSATLKYRDRYDFGAGLKPGVAVRWNHDGRPWLVYDADAEGTGVLLILVSPEYNYLVRGVAPSEVEVIS